jgi:Glycosyl hydrolases family 2, sugar binding domain
MYPHRIRLRGPWECEPLARIIRHADGRTEETSQDLPPRCTMTMPCRWSDDGGLTDFAGRVRCRRRFGLPRRIDDFERVWLTCDGVEESAVFWLNAHLLGQQETANTPFEFDVTALLQERNDLVIELTAPEGNGGLREVALEVRCAVFLRNVQLSATSSGKRIRLHAAGEIGGKVEQPLDLYVILGRHTVGYQTVSRDDTRFAIDSEELTAEQLGSRRVHDVRVELVNGAVGWYTFHQNFEFRDLGT